MLIEFKVTNFRSIREEQTLSFIGSNYSDESPDNYLMPELPGMKDVRLLKTAAIYGANASGKSSVLLALGFLSDFVANSFSLKPEAETGAVPFRLGGGWDEKPSLFEIAAVIDGIRYVYGLGLTQQRVTEEYLIAFPNGKPQTWFERDWNAEDQDYIWSEPTEYFKYDNIIRESSRDNCSFISTGAQFNHAQLGRLQKWFSSELFGPDKIDSMYRTAELFFNEDPVVLNRTLSLLSHADLGVTNISVSKNATRAGLAIEQVIQTTSGAISDILAKLRYRVELSHKSETGPIPLKFEEESNGTRRMFDLIGPFLKAISLGSVVCIDEIDTSLHHFLVVALIKLFLNPQVNIKGAQLLFTTHNPLLLDQTFQRRDQVWFTEKDDNGATHLYPLTDYKPRPKEALVKGYLAGRYGGIPFIPEGLLPQ